MGLITKCLLMLSNGTLVPLASPSRDSILSTFNLGYIESLDLHMQMKLAPEAKAEDVSAPISELTF